MTSTFSIKLILLAAIVGIAYSVGIYEQCAGEGYGTFPCAPGLACFRRNKFYSSCQASCPRNLGWECETAAAVGWEQCGGQGWTGAVGCPAGYACYARSVYYSQCRPVNDCPADWACRGLFVPITSTIPGPVILPVYAQCNGVGNAICPAGTACFRSNAVYSECRPSCPSGWACATAVAGPNEQCGGEGYVGLTGCAAGYACYARTASYSQCRPVNDCPAGWACGALFSTTTPTTPGPVILAAYAQCNGVGNAFCPAGTACFRSNAVYSECRPSCPPTWACATDVAGLNEQCGGEGYIGLTRCAAGYACYANTASYSQCRVVNDCPAGWACGALFNTTATPTTLGPVILPAYAQCNGVGNAICPAGTACFRSNALYAECRPACPPTWACETDVAGATEQCGGEGYVGITRCAEGLRCYARSKWYSQCAASCPGVEWAC